MWMVLGSCDRTSPEEKWALAVSQRIDSGYQVLHDRSLALVGAVQGFCSNPTDLTTPREHWRQTMNAWQDIQWVHFGPIVEDNDDWKIQFWPDKKNIVARKMDKLLADDKAISVEEIANSSVVLQGVSAIELLLFDAPYASHFSEGNDLAAKQCQMLTAITANLSITTGKILQKWRDPGFQATWLESVTQPQDGVHSNAVADVVGAMLSQLERVKIDKVGGPLGYKNRNRQPNGYFSEGWRSESSFDNIKTNLLSMQNLMVNEDAFDLRKLLESKGNGVIADEFQARINEGLSLLATIDKPLHVAAMDVGYRHQLEELYQSLGALNSLIKTKLTAALGINLGFNSNDGD